jgi:hypothetical protein
MNTDEHRSGMTTGPSVFIRVHLWKRYLLLVAAAATFIFMGGMRWGLPQSTGSLADLERAFVQPPDDAKIMMRWWWFGTSVTKPRLEREMQLMKEAGIGGFEIQPVYPLALDDAASGIKNQPFLSGEFLDALTYTNRKARELGLRVDLTVGSGWPYGGPQIPISQAAGRLRVEKLKFTGGQRRLPLPSLSGGEKLLAIFLDSQQEVAEVKEGFVHPPAGLTGDHELQIFIASRTGMMVKRPAVGAEGFVLDHYDRSAIDRYLQTVGEPLVKAFGDQAPYAVFCDSLEVFGSDWTADFLAQFQKRRGYDLKPYLPALISDIGPKTGAIRHDWGRTLTELLNERFLEPMQAWAKNHQTRFRIQGYGIPPATIASNAFADLSEGEGYQWKVVRASRWASSANHLFGRPVTSSETWTWLHSPSFRATPLDVKAEADLHFVQGVNQLIGHGWPYTPEGVEYPGWRFYAAAVFNEKNPWWIAMPDLSKYLQRVSFMLRQGQPSNDVAFYLPNSDAWAGFTSGRVHYLIEALRDRVGPDAIAEVLEAGFNLDFFDDDVLGQIGKIEKGELILGQNRYRAIVLPNVERAPVATLQKLEEFARSGGALIASRRLPALAPGFKATAEEQSLVRDLTKKLFEGGTAPAHFVQQEKGQLGAKLVSLLAPDMKLEPAATDIGFIHRRTDAAEIYFLANTSNQRRSLRATFGGEQPRTDLHAELWDPMTGAIAPAAMLSAEKGVAVQLDLEPYGSRLVVLTKRSLKKPASPVQQKYILALNDGWRLSFGAEGKPSAVNSFRSWTDDESTRWYSGTATYEKDVKLPDSWLQSEREIRLEFGEGQAVPEQPRKNGMRAWFDGPVRDAAVVSINGVRAGAVWCPPYSLRLTGLLKPGNNHLKITVGNTAINFLSGRRLPDYKLLNLRYGERFQAQDLEKLEPLPSGLLGEIRLIAQ